MVFFMVEQSHNTISTISELFMAVVCHKRLLIDFTNKKHCSWLYLLAINEIIFFLSHYLDILGLAKNTSLKANRWFLIISQIQDLFALIDLFSNFKISIVRWNTSMMAWTKYYLYSILHEIIYTTRSHPSTVSLL